MWRETPLPSPLWHSKRRLTSPSSLPERKGRGKLLDSLYQRAPPEMGIRDRVGWNEPVVHEHIPMDYIYHISYISFAAICYFQFRMIALHLSMSIYIGGHHQLLSFWEKKHWKDAKPLPWPECVCQQSIVTATHASNIIYFCRRPTAPCSSRYRTAMLCSPLPVSLEQTLPSAFIWVIWNSRENKKK